MAFKGHKTLRILARILRYHKHLTAVLDENMPEIQEYTFSAEIKFRKMGPLLNSSMKLS
jgi:hypothetical protein